MSNALWTEIAVPVTCVLAFIAIYLPGYFQRRYERKRAAEMVARFEEMLRRSVQAD